MITVTAWFENGSEQKATYLSLEAARKAFDALRDDPQTEGVMIETSNEADLITLMRGCDGEIIESDDLAVVLNCN